MLLEEDKLRWLGLDLRPRWHRRVLVVLTYVLYVAVLCGRWPWIAAAACPLLILDLGWGEGSPLSWGETWVGWTFRALFLFVVGRLVYSEWVHPDPQKVAMSSFFIFLWLSGNSVLGVNKYVDSGDGGWMGQAVKKTSGLNGRQQRRLARMGFAIGLDGYSWYEYRLPFRRLTAEQKREIEELSLAHPRGEWMGTQAKVLLDDERLRYAEERLRAQVQRVLSWILVLVTIALSIVLRGKHTVDKDLVLFILWVLVGLVTTLRQAIVLWTEEDPRDLAGEIALVDGAHA